MVTAVKLVNCVVLVILVKLKCHPQLANFIFIAGHRKEKGTDYETVSTLEHALNACGNDTVI